MKHELNFQTDYRQFYVSDKNFPYDTGSEKFWTEQAFEDKLAVENGVIGIGIENDEGNVNCKLSILETKSDRIDFSNFDHIVEASLKIKSGKLQVTDCPNSHVELEVEIEPGEYRIRVYSNNLKTACDENPKDSYQIEIWKEAISDRKVLKRFHG